MNGGREGQRMKCKRGDGRSDQAFFCLLGPSRRIWKGLGTGFLAVSAAWGGPEAPPQLVGANGKERYEIWWFFPFGVKAASL